MGIVVAISARNSGNEVWWASEGRGPATAKRAREAGLRDGGTVADLCRTVQAIVSVCPPEAAERVAEEVRGNGFRGLYIEANAIAPAKVQRIAEMLSPSGIRVADGGIVGLPSLEAGETWLHLSGPGAEEAAALFRGGALTAGILGPEIGRASALKMCFAAYNKGAIALALAAASAAAGLGVLEELLREWDRKGPGAGNLERNILRAAPKAWRWAPEMQEIAATLASQGIPGEFHEACRELYARLTSLKDDSNLSLTEVLATSRE
jgi:3-hydroxyisobutyrate dehydrogenase-like beta-hydroxyacid dehydrogenase